VGQGLLVITASRSRSDTPHIRQDSSDRVFSSTQKPLPANKQHSQQKNIHATFGIRTHNPRKRAAADPRLSSRGNCDRTRVIYFCYVMNLLQLQISTELCENKRLLWTVLR